MELQEALLKRRSIRKFKEDKIKDEDIDTILHMAMAAPSAMNKKPWEFYVISNQDKLDELKSSGLYKGYDAPLAIIVAANKLRFIPLAPSYWIQDCSAATMNILNTVTDVGLGAVWCGVYPVKNTCKKISKILELPINIVPLNIIYIGYPDENKEARDQYEDKLVHYIK